MLPCCLLLHYIMLKRKRSIYQLEADLIPNEKEKTLTVKLHYPANPASGKIIAHLCDEMNLTETQFPGTNMRIIYKLGTG